MNDIADQLLASHRLRAARMPGDLGPNGTNSRRSTSTLWSGPVPIDPRTGMKYVGAVIGMARGSSSAPAAGLKVGAVVSVAASAAGAGLSGFRRFAIYPGPPLNLALGEYDSVTVDIISGSAAAGADMNLPVTLMWTSSNQLVSGAFGDLQYQSPYTTVTIAPAFNLVPDGAVTVLFADAGTVTWQNSCRVGANAIEALFAIALAANVRTPVLGDAYTYSVGSTAIFFLAAI